MKPFIRTISLLCLLTAAATPCLSASLHFDPSVTSGNWTDASWGPDGGPYDQSWSSGEDAVLAPSAAATIRTASGSPFTLNSLNVSGGGHDLSGGTLNLGTGGFIWTATANIQNLTLANIALGGSQTWTISGNQKPTLSGGQVNLSGHTLTVNIQAASSTLKDIALTGSGTLKIDGILGRGLYGIASGVLDNSNIILSFADADAELWLKRYANMKVGGISSAGGTLAVQNSITKSVVTIETANGKSYTFGGAISVDTDGTIDVVKTGLGTQVLSGANTYRGATTVSAGSLLVNGSHTGGGAYTVASDATLGGSGTIGAAVTVQSGGILSPGNSPGVITISDLTLADSAIVHFEPGDRTDVTNLLDINQWTLALTGNDATWAKGGSTVIFNYGSINNNGGANYLLKTNVLFPSLSFDPVNDPDIYLYDTGSSIVLMGMYVIPEAETSTLLLGGILALLAFRRLRHA